MNVGKILSLQEITAQQADRCTRAQNTLLNSASTCGDAFLHFKMHILIMMTAHPYNKA